MHILFLDRMQLIPERQPARDDQSNENANQKEPAIGGQHDQQNRYDNDGDDETSRSSQAKSQAESRSAARFRLHDLILARLLGLGVRAKSGPSSGLGGAGNYPVRSKAYYLGRDRIRCKGPGASRSRGAGHAHFHCKGVRKNE
jgi:hypothetical protein